jgi:hypothetical protein
MVVVTGSTSVQSFGLISNVLLQANGGLDLSNGLSINSLGLRVTSNGLTIQNNGLIVTGGFTIQDTGSSIGFIRNIGTIHLPSSALSVSNAGLFVTGGATINFGGVSVADGLTIINAGLRLTNGVSVLVGGLVVTNGLTVNTGGSVLPGGLTLLGSGLVVDRLVKIDTDSGMNFDSGVVLNNLAMMVTGGMTINAGGISTPSITVGDGALRVTDGVSVYSSGIITPSLTVNTNGLFVTSGLTTVQGGFSTPSIRIRRGGLSASGPLNMLDSFGVTITDGLTINTGGLLLTGGITVDFGYLSTGGLSVVNDGFLVFGGDIFYVREGGSVFNIPGQNLTVYGGTSLEFNYFPSDQRLKQNVVLIPHSLDMVRQMRGIEYDTVDDPNTRRLGVLAQDVEAVLPGLVHPFRMSPKIPLAQHVLEEVGEERVFKSVDYISLIPVLLNSLVELLDKRKHSHHMEKNVDCGSRFACPCLKKYKGRIDALHDRLSDLEVKRTKLRYFTDQRL